jgi:hypothetical protein
VIIQPATKAEPFAFARDENNIRMTAIIEMRLIDTATA